MRKHNGMRPQDIVILLKILTLGKTIWYLKDLAEMLYLSISEVSESLNRSYLAGLIDYNKKKVKRQSFFEFLQFGFKYVFPVHPGGLVNGIPTAHAHLFMKQFFDSDLPYVWPDIHGKERGLMVEPLYAKQTEAVKHDQLLYKLLALTDVIRLGKRREINIALEELSTFILNEQPPQQHNEN